jgi:hypothetical protein
MRTSRMIMLSAPLAVALMAAPVLAHGPGGACNGPGAACNGPGGACSGAKEQIKKLCSGVTPGDCLTTLCKDVQPGPGQWPQCLLNLNSAGTLKPALTKSCVTDLNNKLAAIQNWQKTLTAKCGADVSANCANVTGGMGVTMQCLHQAVIDNKPVSKDCQALLAEHHGHHRQHHGPGEPGPKGATGK